MNSLKNVPGINPLLLAVAVFWNILFQPGSSFASVPASATPGPDQYYRLCQVLAHYRQLEAGLSLPPIPPDTCLQTGQESTYTAALRQRLVLFADLPPDHPTDSLLFDEQLRKAVKRFQARHGLLVDGVVGENTLAALNVPLRQRITQLEINLERWRQFEPDTSQPYVFVNVPDYTLQVVEQGKPVLDMRVIVGKTGHQTLSFSSAINEVVLRPGWYVPASIAQREILPMLKRDPNYLLKNNMRLYRQKGRNRVEINPRTIPWASLTAEQFTYLVVQDPGPTNSLGQVKFLFPNPHHIYLHDTPEKSLFQNRYRTYSHGCVRVEKPEELATYLLQTEKGWNRQIIEQWIQKGTSEKAIPLTRPVPIHISYFTAWVSDTGEVHFRPDVYGQDLQSILHPPMTPLFKALD